MYVTRERLAHLQAILAGGRISPGCITAEAFALLVLAAVLFLVSVRLGLR